jgi:hypothetical protein
MRTPDEVRAYNARKSELWRQRHPEKWQEVRQRFRATAKGRIYMWSNTTSGRLRKADGVRGQRDANGKWRRKKMPGSTITGLELRELWHAQDGRCALTGQEMQLRNGKASIHSVSVDRIDPAIGYHPGNVRLVTYQANAAKLMGTDADLIAFCKRLLAFQMKE